MDAKLIAKLVFFLSLNVSFCRCFVLEPGIYETNLTLQSNQSSSLYGFIKNMFEDSEIGVTINEAQCADGTTFKVEWMLRYSDCHGLYSAEYQQDKNTLEELWSFKDVPFMFEYEDMIDIIRSSEGDLRECDTHTILKYEAVDYQCYSRFNTTHCTYVPRVTASTDNTVPQETPPQKDTNAADKTTAIEDDNSPVGSENSDSSIQDDVSEQDQDANQNTDETINDTEQEKPEENTINDNEQEKPEEKTEDKKSRRRKRAAENTDKKPEETENEPDEKKAGETDDPNKQAEKTDVTEKSKETSKPLVKNRVTKTAMAGSHIFILSVTVETGHLSNLSVKVEMKSKHGFLSAYQYPLLKFYGLMCGVYSILAFTWLLLMARQWRELLGIQFWIGGVIILGLIEKAVFYAEYEQVNNNGTASSTGLIFPELVSCMKRTLARLLVIIVSIGYGITRPRLGQDFHWLMIAGGLYFVLSSLEAVLRVTGNAENEMIAVLPLSVLDAVIVWWIFKNLVDTTRTLRLRRNITKLWLYRHFTNALILCIIFSLAYFLWQFKMHQLAECVKNWSELWLDDAFWHILFCVILVTIMILLRPSVNNQRYAYSPLGDEEEGDDESKDPMLSEAYDGMKMRNVKKDEVRPYKDADDDLKWVEDNIPAAIADTALATFDDSEEELVTNLERSKME